MLGRAGAEPCRPCFFFILSFEDQLQVESGLGILSVVRYKRSYCLVLEMMIAWPRVVEMYSVFRR